MSGSKRKKMGKKIQIMEEYGKLNKTIALFKIT
jgi:hypothetical protein